MTVKKDKIKHDFNKKADYYNSNAKIQRKIANDLVAFAYSKIKNNSIILDVGSGTGQIAEALDPKHHKNITLLDNSKSMLEIAQTNFPACKFIYKDFDDLSDLPDRYDCIFANMSLHWSNDHKLIISNLRNLLNDKGNLFISLPTENSFKELKSINKNLHKKLDLAPLITTDDLDANKITLKSYKENFNSLFEILKHFKKNGTGSKNTGIKPLKKSDYQFLLNNNYKVKSLSWEIAFLKFNK
ncbi:MAG: methyltransferase domain-containing protein [Rickettsiales bacterium]|nr:methyltransferase domain-containing protein [Rickettsiales bacterium]